MKHCYPANVLAAAITLVMMSTPVLADMDDDIEAAAHNSHVFKTYLKNDNIKVDVDDGVATLSGTVHEESHKSLAQETVTNLPGVTSVDNQLDFEGNSPAEKSDEWLVTKVKTTLLFHKNVSALTEVSAKNGIVTLSGKADNQAQIELTSEYASDVEGVTKVENKMTVAASPGNTRTLGDKIDDASITTAVKMVLLSHRSTSAIHTKVATKDGVVTLSGDAKNDAEISLVTKLVSDTNGVNEVKNEMTVK